MTIQLSANSRSNKLIQKSIGSADLKIDAGVNVLGTIETIKVTEGHYLVYLDNCEFNTYRKVEP